jgi:hypothetical protein
MNTIPGFTAQSSIGRAVENYVDGRTLLASVSRRGEVLPTLGPGIGSCPCWNTCARICREHPRYCGQCFITCGHICG